MTKFFEIVINSFKLHCTVTKTIILDVIEILFIEISASVHLEASLRSLQ